MRTALLTFILMLAQAALAASEVATLQELLNDTNRSGVVPLDHGYRGEFTEVYDEVPSGMQGVAEFTHAWFNHRGVGNRSGAAPTIAIGISRKEENGQPVRAFRALATYKKTIPDFEALKKMPRSKISNRCSGPSGWTPTVGDSRERSIPGWVGWRLLFHQEAPSGSFLFFWT